MHEIPLVAPPDLFIQAGNLRIELHDVVTAAAHAIGDPRRQGLATRDALSRLIVEGSFLRHGEFIEPQG
jgi:hypothetical protein